jgi:hypothetical protein
MEVINQDKVHMKTMSSCINMLTQQGFSTQFKATGNGLKSLTTEKVFKADEIKILNFYRFEGESDPSDNAILYAIETINGERGTIADAFGMYNDAAITKFMADVEDIQKKTQKGTPL